MRAIALIVASGLAIALYGAVQPLNDTDGGGSQLISGHATSKVSGDRSRLDVALERPSTSTPASRESRGIGLRAPTVEALSAAPRGIDWASATTGDLGGSAPTPCIHSGTQIPCAAAPVPAQGGPSAAASSGPRIPTLTDIASFRPSPPALVMEPSTFAITGRPTNFVVSAAPQTLTGTLFDLPVRVRFTPALYRFDYGDGSTKTTTTAGSAWKSGDAPLFTPTGTSHTYTHKGQITARVAVAYAAQVSFTGYPGWYNVDGYVTATAPAHQFRVYIAHTVLVEHTCNEDPHGPGCPGTTR